MTRSPAATRGSLKPAVSTRSVGRHEDGAVRTIRLSRPVAPLFEPLETSDAGHQVELAERRVPMHTGVEGVSFLGERHVLLVQELVNGVGAKSLQKRETELEMPGLD